MSPFADAQELYRKARELLDMTRDLAVADDALRWLREDLEEALLDLKLALIDLDARKLERYIDECRWLLAGMRRRVSELNPDTEK